MKALRNLVDKMKPAFAKGGKLEKLHWVFDGLETFLFTPGHATERGAHIRDGIDMKRTMSVVIIAMLPCLLFGMWNVGHQHFLALGQPATGPAATGGARGAVPAFKRAASAASTSRRTMRPPGPEPATPERSI